MNLPQSTAWARAAMDESVVALLRHFATHSDDAELAESPGSLMVAAGVEHLGPMHNAVIRKSPDADPGTVLDAASAFFHERGRRFVLWIAAHRDGELARAATSRGFRPRDASRGSAGMVACEPLRARPARHLRIEPVRTADDTRVFADIVAAAFAARPSPQPLAASLSLFRRPDALLDRDVLAYVASAAGAPCGAAMAYLESGVANLCWVSTHPGHRRRGVATSLVVTSVAESFRRGAALVGLQSSSEAERLYRDLGFTELTRYQRLLSPPAGEDH